MITASMPLHHRHEGVDETATALEQHLHLRPRVHQVGTQGDQSFVCDDEVHGERQEA
jgi:hypothetical protein